jgi:hypothetical protein
MDEIALRKALATFRAFVDNLPKGHWIEEKYVALYHALLSDIQAQTHQDLSYFRIPDSELTRRASGGSQNEYGDFQPWYTSNRQCDRSMFLIKLNGAMNFIASFLADPGKRIIGFVP